MDDAPEKERAASTGLERGNQLGFERTRVRQAAQQGKVIRERDCAPVQESGLARPRLTPLLLPAQCGLTADISFIEALLFMNSFHRPSELGSTPYNHPHFYRQRNKGCPRGGKFKEAHRCQGWDGKPGGWLQSPCSYP